MEKVYEEQEIIGRIIDLLRQTSLYEDQYKKLVSGAFYPENGFHDDLAPYIEVLENGYQLVQYERGMLALNKFTDQVDVVIFWIMEDVLFRIAYLKLLEEYRNERPLRFTADRVKEVTIMLHQAFAKIGDIYEQWHIEGRRSVIESPLRPLQ
ncbi:hypothetical protein DCC85_12270 [Paenibacillus sp. CAA11]|uniref:Imm63 family immunity protein n=1 Tax=Paenibacillus sp. CAA11 TaxID=1532905 RepID=UPI000D36A067|nr:Imm63 family immunity protein [Paenibacillus sp. CAA11]AWB44918.1 hypothetical protein DCC85_12270 [Paenibacillus sp. CAA11]